MFGGSGNKQPPLIKAGAGRRYNTAPASGARLHKTQRLLDVLNARKRDAQGLGNLRSALAGLDELLDACAGLVGDDGALPALRLRGGLGRLAPAGLAGRSADRLQRLHEIIQRGVAICLMEGRKLLRHMATPRRPPSAPSRNHSAWRSHMSYGGPQAPCEGPGQSISQVRPSWPLRLPVPLFVLLPWSAYRHHTGTI